MLLALLLGSWPGQAQVVRQRDTSSVFKATQLIAPGLLLAWASISRGTRPSTCRCIRRLRICVRKRAS